MKTRDKIILESVKLFNRYGVSKVTIRQIASALSISPGNLTYHFKNKEVIISEIYRRMDEEMSDAVFPGKEASDLLHFHALLNRISEFQQAHRFFYLDMLEISRKYPSITQKYRNTIKIRRAQTDLLFESLIEKGFLKPESNPGIYRSLTHAIWVMSTFWLQQKQILGSRHRDIKERTDMYHIWNILLPYLTPNGLEQFKGTEVYMNFYGNAIEIERN